MKIAETAPATRHAPLSSGLERWLSGVWWRSRPGAMAWVLWPLSVVYRLLVALDRLRAGRPRATPAPVIVVGNLVVGGAGKTPIVIALVQALHAAGRRPGVISRGHGGRSAGADEITEVGARSSAREVGDEPLLIRRRTGAPVFVGRRRTAAAAAL